MNARRHSQRGVTLPELLVALFVFALISSVGVYVLRLAVDGRAQLTENDAVLREWQLARMVIREDLMQVVNRTVRDEFGDFQPGPMIGGIGFRQRRPAEGEEPLIGFVRGGWENFDPSTPRSTLQYVEYVWVAGDIVRRTRSYLDDMRDQPSRDRVLFTAVENVTLDFLVGEDSRGLQWSQDWPVGAAGPPRALRLQFTSDAFGEMEQLFWIGDVGAGAG